MTESESDTHDKQLSALYRGVSRDEPSPALDARILESARKEVHLQRQTTPAPTPWWKRWSAPAGAFATLVLTVTLALMVERHRPELTEKTTGGATTMDRTEPTRAADSAAPQPAVPPATQPAPPSGSVTATKTRPAEARMQEQAPAAPAPALGAPSPAIPPHLQKAVPAPYPASPARPAEDDMRMKSEAMNAEAASGAVVLGGAAPAAAKAANAPAAAQRSAEARDIAQRTPESWIEDIRRLRREGKTLEFQKQLEAFQKVHPDYALPEDLHKP